MRSYRNLTVRQRLPILIPFGLVEAALLTVAWLFLSDTRFFILLIGLIVLLSLFQSLVKKSETRKGIK